MARFPYSSLGGIESRLVRVLVLDPATSTHAPIKCRLVTVPHSALPRYEAVSYTWDNQKRTQAIHCDGARLPVTPNVESAMRHLRRSYFPRRLWIDSVCIDQDNPAEKIAQLPKMDTVYRSAKRVIVWLGEGTPDTDQAIFTLKWTLPLYRLGLNLPFCRYMAKHLLARFRTDFQKLLDHTGSDVAPLKEKGSSLYGLHKLVHHSWFRRIWTLQEISMAKNATVQCGSRTVPWSAFSNMLTFEGTWMQTRVPYPIKADGGYNPGLALRQDAFVARIHQINCLREWVRDVTSKSATRPPISFMLNLILTGVNPCYESSVPEDKFYGLLGLLRLLGTDMTALELAKSDLDTIHGYVFATMATQSNSLRMLIHTNGESSRPGLPSWLPSHSPVPWTPGLDDVIFKKAATPHMSSAAPKFSFDSDNRILKLRGQFIDKITGVTTTRPDGKETSSTGTTDLGSFLQAWLTFVRDQVRHLNLSYHDEALVLFKLLVHRQVSEYYDSAGVIGPYYASGGQIKATPSVIPFRLLQHFEAWLDKMDAGVDNGIERAETLFDSAQHFISSELINSRSTADDARVTIGYPRALEIIGRWAEEQTLRKRLFATQRGAVGIAWRSVQPEDDIILVDGLTTPLVLRRLRTHDDTSYRLLGPCHMPQLPGAKLWDFLPLERKTIRIV
ncbi:heterokaryon incompatibility protein-domain-containing protein [Echria macrotheca]|uniref:Heterokaryon incompatibility protein-domain-containing protein n=1 Tax=Echria macrotheca TaxID=438768 RepID=A0AAJ0BIS7_9PEZI|nr:heterokaryon incompatibility protein-domain-containing protein [Echria macrotheca]